MTDRNQIELAILNLAINTRDAMPLGGALSIAAPNETVTTPRDGMAAGDYVVVGLSDTGSGMPPEVLARVLEPFFTTKPAGKGKGTGLDLSMVAGVVRQLKGGLTITSEVGKGTCVSLYLPRAEAGAPATGTATNIQGARIPLVDDDSHIQAIIPEHAAGSGHHVTVAKSTVEAMIRLNADDPIDLLVVDYSIPGLSYLDLAAQARLRRPDLPVLVISGKIDTPVPVGFPLLVKPFRNAAFDKTVSALLAERERRGNVVPFRSDSARAG
jgi:CheY-like chemotaxis protein